MIYPEITVEEWERKWLIVPDEGYCICGKKHKTTKPFISKKYVGFVSENCDCGAYEPIITFIPRSEAEKEKRK